MNGAFSRNDKCPSLHRRKLRLPPNEAEHTHTRSQVVVFRHLYNMCVLCVCACCGPQNRLIIAGDPTPHTLAAILSARRVPESSWTSNFSQVIDTLPRRETRRIPSTCSSCPVSQSVSQRVSQ